MKGYYIHFDGSRTPGVRKKIKMQIRELQNYFDMEEIEIRLIPGNLLQRILRQLPFGAVARDYEGCLEKLDQPDFVYIRRTLADRYYIRFLKTIRQAYPQCRVLIEIYTYPYDKDEFGKWYAWPRYCKEVWNRKKIPAWIDRYVTVSREEWIFGKETIRISNGIQIDQIRPVSGISEKGEQLDMIAVAYMQKQHGYERIIEGMYDYYQNGGDRQVYLHLVGDGPEKSRYQKLVKKRGLEKKVLFYPNLTGEKLDRVFEQKDIAIAALGLYKNGICYESSLKSREYLARGLPMVTGCEVDVFEKKKCDFHCGFPNDGSGISIQRILAFCDRLYAKGRRDVQNHIRQYAQEMVSMDKAMKEVVDYLRNSSR